MIAGALLYTFSSAAYLLAPSFWPFFVVRIFHGVGMAFFNTSAVTLIVAISPEAHRGQTLSYFYISFNISFALAPSFGMFLINLFGFPPLFFFCIGLSLCSLFLTSRIAKRQVEGPEKVILSRGPLISREALPPAMLAFFTHVILGNVNRVFSSSCYRE
jgi:MFS family permease